MAAAWKPHFSQKGKVGRVSYELPTRVHSVKVYPIPASNGSTVIIYGTDNSISAIWRGGDAKKDGKSLASKASRQGRASAGTSKSASIEIIDVDDDDKHSAKSATNDVYPDAEEALDWSRPYAPILKEATIRIGAKVLDIALPPVRQRSSHVFVAARCSDNTTRVASIPLDPFTDTKASVKSIAHPGSPTSVALTELEDSTDLLIASALDIARGVIQFTCLHLTAGFSKPPHILQTVYLESRAIRISFNPSSSSDKRTQLLVAETSGSVSIYKPLSSPILVDSLSTAFKSAQSSETNAPSLTLRKRIIDADWAVDGKAIFVLLANGEWGVWDLGGAAPGSGKATSWLNEFALQGILGGLSPTSPANLESKTSRKSRSSLAPATPNTRRQKQADLFSSIVPSSRASSGGLSVRSVLSRSGSHAQTSVTMWYDNQIFAIPSLQAFWLRAVKENTSGCTIDVPGLTLVDGAELYGERITSIDRLPDAQQDFIASAEHRLVFIEHEPPPAPSLVLIPSLDEEEQARKDRVRLARGDLDIGALDRMLDQMESST